MRLSIEEVVSEISDQWMEINGVEGIGQGKVDDKDCITVCGNRLRNLGNPEGVISDCRRVR